MIVVSGGILMKKTLLAGMMAAAASVMMPGMAGAETVTADVPTGSVYYDYVDKLSGMGYIDALPDGARPYSRMQMAKWVLQAEKNAKSKPMPAYLADELASMRQAFGAEIAVLRGRANRRARRMSSRMHIGSRLARARRAMTTRTASMRSPRRRSRATSATRRLSR